MKDEIVNSIKSILDSFDNLTKWFVGIAVVVCWSGFVKSTGAIALFEIDTKNAFLLFGMLFCVVNYLYFSKFNQLRAILTSVSGVDQETLIYIILTHAWDLNPFKVSTPGLRNRLPVNISCVAAVFIWWACFISLLKFGTRSGYILPTEMFYISIVIICIGIGSLSIREIIRLSRAIEIGSADSQITFIKLNAEKSVLKLRLSLLAGIVIGSLTSFI